MASRDEIILSVVNWILKEEGGVADVGDGMGLTRWGQTEGWLGEWHLTTPLTQDEARSNYVKWVELSGLGRICVDGGDDLLPTVVGDFMINSGESTGIKALQGAVGVIQDGVLGDVTANTVLHSPHPLAVALLVLDARIELDGRIITRNPKTDSQFASNWFARCGRQLRRIAAAMKE